MSETLSNFIRFNRNAHMHAYTIWNVNEVDDDGKMYVDDQCRLTNTKLKHRKTGSRKLKVSIGSIRERFVQSIHNFVLCRTRVSNNKTCAAYSIWKKYPLIIANYSAYVSCMKIIREIFILLSHRSHLQLFFSALSEVHTCNRFCHVYHSGWPICGLCIAFE